MGGKSVIYAWKKAHNGTSRKSRFNYEICDGTYPYGLRFKALNATDRMHHVRFHCQSAPTAGKPACVFDGGSLQGVFTSSNRWSHVGLWIEGHDSGSIEDLVFEGLEFREFRGRGVRINSSTPVSPANYSTTCAADSGNSYLTNVDTDTDIDIFDHSYCDSAYSTFTGAGVATSTEGPAITLTQCSATYSYTGMLINAQNVLLDRVFAEYNEGTGIYVDFGSNVVMLSPTVRQNGYPDAACVGVPNNLACSDNQTMRAGIVIDAARAVIKDGWVHHNGARGIELYRNVGEFGSHEPRAWIAAAYIEGNEIHDNGTDNGKNIRKFPTPNGTWAPPFASGVSIGGRQGVSYYAMKRPDGMSSGPSNRQTWVEPWKVDLTLPAHFAEAGAASEHQKYNKRDYAVAELVGNRIYENYVGVYVGSSLDAGASVGFNYRLGSDDSLRFHSHTVNASRLKNNLFCPNSVGSATDCAGEVDTLTDYPVFVGAPSVFENCEKYKFSGWDAFDKPVEVWGNNHFIGANPALKRDTLPGNDSGDWDVDITGYYADNGFFSELDWWQVACDVQSASGSTPGKCNPKLVRCWEDDDCPVDSAGKDWKCNTTTHDCYK